MTAGAGRGPGRSGAPGSRDTALRRVVEDVVAVLPAWVVARVLLTAAYVVAVAAADRLTPGADPSALREGLVAWDGTWYRDLAQGGYGSLPDEALRFFPLFPLAGRMLGLLLGGHDALALVLLANVASLAFAVGVRRLVLAEGRSRAVAERAVWYTALFPSAFVLAWAYAEAVMLAAVVAAFAGARRGRWWWTALAGVVAGATRPLGLLLVVPVGLEALRAWRHSSARTRLAAVLATGAPAVGTGLYLTWVRISYGDALLPFTVQGDLRGDTVDPLRRLVDGVGDLLGPERFGDGLHLPFAVGFLALLVLTFRCWPASYGAYAAAVLVVSLAAENLNSLERYGLNAVPLVLTLAVLTRDPRVDRGVLAVSAAGFVALASLAWLGAYVP